jgi:mannose-1-phosphate guanylyltransferase/mannose-6-phosphate isomerase
MANPIIPLIMCGGAGTRLWPASRENRPKQFLPLFGSYSTFQETIRRVSDPALFGRPIIVTNGQYRFLVAEQLAAIGAQADILLEPMRRDSGPAIVAGSEFARRRTKDAIVVALAADHVVTDAVAFAKVCAAAAQAAADNRIVTFGVRPTRAATEYGYIRAGAAIGADIFAIERFVEKPDASTAQRYLGEGYLWNSGNFLFRAELLLDEYRAFEPDSAAAIVSAVEAAGNDLNFVTLDPGAFARAAAKSIDYAVMERTKHAAVMPVSYGWSDVGSWQAVWELSSRDTADNAAQGSALFVDASGCYVAADKQLVTLYGLQNVVVVTTADAVLVAKREDGDGLGLLSVARPRRALPGQAHRRQARRPAVATDAPPSRRALGRGSWHRPGDDRRLSQNSPRKRIDLRAERGAPSPGKSRQDRPRSDRGPDRILSR